MTTTPPTELELDEIETRAAARRTALSGWINCYSPLSEQEALEGAEAVLEEDVPALLAEVRRQRTQLAAVRAFLDEQDRAARLFELPTPAWVEAVRAACAASAAPLSASHASSVSESAQSPTGAPEALLRDAERYLSAMHGSVARHDNLAANYGCAGCQLRDKIRAQQAGEERQSPQIAPTRSDLAALLAHHADIIAARWRAVAPGAGAWEVAAALALTSHANELSAETERPAVAELLDNIWTFHLEQRRGEALAGPDGEAPTPPRRTLTPNEYSAAWHAVEGAAGEEGADPATVLHAVLNRLGIDTPPAEGSGR